MTMAKIRRDIWLYLAMASIIAGIVIFSSVVIARGHINSTHTAIDADFKTLNMTVGRIKFEGEPKGRGTVGILLSCTLTFVFCIWTVVHPNVLPNSTWKSRLVYKAVLMVIAVINPEGVVISAYGQWQDARLLNQAIDNYFEKLIKSPDSSVKTAKEMEKRRLEWLGMDGAFFVVMGGFLIDISNCESDENVGTPTMKKRGTVEPREPSRFTATLTPPGFIKYMHEGYFDDFEHPPFNRTQIGDKGKASNIAKVLSASQALWLLIQSAARWAMGLRLSLLEIHILIQVACTALIFFFWWYKPLDVDQPIRLKLVKKVGGKPVKVTPIKDIERNRTKKEAASILVSMERVDIGNEPPPKVIDIEDARPKTTSSASSNTPPAAPRTPPDTASSRTSSTPLMTTETVESTTTPITEPTTTPTVVRNISSSTARTTPNASPQLILPFADIPDWEFVHPLRRPFTITRSQSHMGMKARALHDVVFYITGGTLNEDMTKAPKGIKSRVLKKKKYNDDLGSESESEDDYPEGQGKELRIYEASAVISTRQSLNSASEPGMQIPAMESRGQEISNTTAGLESRGEFLNPFDDLRGRTIEIVTEIDERSQNTVGDSGSDRTTPTTPGDESATLIPQVLDEKQKKPKRKRSGGNRRMFCEGVFIGIIAFLHGLAWNVYFPTDIERLAWRLSCIGMFAFPLPAIMIASFASYHDDLSKLLWYLACAQYKLWQWVWHATLCIYDMANVHRRKATILGTRRLTLCCHILLIITCLLLLLGYLICILIITYESYLSIRDPPETTFETPRWSDYWPHI